MAERTLRGARIGATSLQSEVGVHYSERKTATYRADDGSTFDVVFSSEAEMPGTWSDLRSGHTGVLLDALGVPVESDDGTEAKIPRSHWDMLLERRSREELEELLEERLTYLRARRGLGDRVDA
ncbi:RNA polymerase-binding protein RbpA [Klugiella xanthotipulae]|uniref:RNA polymerase-binding protein RbpA n=1 Tax=Klugiella xanthotipulae TaxID=244735 RepID=A0A543HT14_9MICO|nr:RNA polymerase-binding protein RbpA [Klugiella xanthotipulae]TQM61399.1 RNA polymerase binding protein RbpA [Klugiella xanthotipulae]